MKSKTIAELNAELAALNLKMNDETDRLAGNTGGARKALKPHHSG